jgi:hypothetical protein
VSHGTAPSGINPASPQALSQGQRLGCDTLMGNARSASFKEAQMAHEYMPFLYSFLGTVVALLLGVLFNNREMRSLKTDTWLASINSKRLLRPIRAQPPADSIAWTTTSEPFTK